MFNSFEFIPRKKSKIIWTLILVLNSTFLQSQISFENLVKLDANDGLPKAQINCSHVDNLGFLWLGTKKGLYKYDGRSFQKHLTEDLKPGKNIKCFIQLDSLHFLIGTDYGIVKFNSLNFDYSYLSFENTLNSNKRSNHIQEIVKSVDDNYWVISTGGVFKIKSDLTIIFSLNFDKTEIITASNLQPPRLCEFSKNEIWLVAPISSQLDKFNIYEIKNNKLNKIIDPPFNHINRFLSFIKTDALNCLFLYEDVNSKVHTGLLNVKTKKISYLKTPTIKFQNFQPFFTNLNDSLIGLDSKGFSHYLVYNTKKSVWQTYIKSYNLDFIKSAKLLKNDIYAVSNDAIFLTSHTSQYIKNIELKNNIIQEKDNRFNYLNLYNYAITTNNNQIEIKGPANAIKTITLKETGIRINQLTALNEKEVILSTNKGTFVLHLEDKLISKLNGKNKPLFFDSLTSIVFKINNNELWFGFVQFKGLVKYTIDTKEFYHVPFEKENDNTFFHDITTITSDHRSRLWLGWIGGGLASFDTKKGKLTVQNQSNIKDVISCITTDNKGEIWYGTNGYGLYEFDPDSLNIKRINKDYDAYITSVVCDSQNNIWFTTSNGLVKLKSDKLTISTFTQRNGLLSDSFEKLEYDKNRQQLILSSDKGISLIEETIPFIENKENKIYINRIFTNNQRYNKHISNIILGYNENNLEIQFSVPDLIEGSNNKYYFTLDTLMDTWQNCDNGEIQLTGLESGSHQVYVKTCNDKDYCIIKKLLLFQVKTPFWKSMTFYALLTFIISSVLYLFFQQRIRSIKKLNELKFKIARDLHDSIGSTLTSIAFLSKAVVSKDLPFQKQSAIADKITESSLEAGNYIEEIIWNLQPKEKSIFEVINRAINQYEEVFNNKKIQFEVYIENDLDKQYLNNLATINLLMTIKEILNNISKHAKADKVKLQLTFHFNQICLEVSDNGVGFDVQSFRGNGIDNMFSRIKEINGKIDIESKVNVGTRILINVPV